MLVRAILQEIMSLIDQSRRQRARVGMTFLLLLLALLGIWQGIDREVVAGQVQRSSAMQWVVQFDANAEIAHVEDVDSSLMHIDSLLSTGKRAEALSVAQELVVRFPNFQLGQLLYADLINWTSTVPVQAWTGEAEGDVERKTAVFNREAYLRIRRPAPSVYEGKEPAGLAYLSPEVPYVVVVDASLSRLYVLAQQPADSDKNIHHRLMVVHESYMSVGQNGIGKQTEGDGKTPLGVYTIQKFMPGYALPDLYGAGAFTLNYPNDIDILQGRTGSGIWIHGSPSAQYARPPEASDGCVVLANPDIEKLVKLQIPMGTPVFIQAHIDWVKPEKNQALRRLLSKTQVRSERSQLPAYEDTMALFGWKEDNNYVVAAINSLRRTPIHSNPVIGPTYWMQQSGQWILASRRG